MVLMHEMARRSVHAALAAVLVVWSTTACSGDDDDDASSTQCTSLQPDQIVEASIEYDGTPSPGTGGPIEEGSYHLTSVTAYIPSNATVLPKCNALADALVLSSGGFEHAVGCYFQADNPETRLGLGQYTGSYSTADTAFVFNYACPTPRLETFPYSAEPPNLRMLVTDPSGSLTTELVWTVE
jgi:hypothetical protein